MSRATDTDTEAIKAGLAALIEPGSVVELRVPDAGRYGVISSCFDDLEAMAEDAAKHSGHVPGVYFTCNPVKPVLLARAANRTITRARLTTSDHDIERRRWLPIDLDPARPAGICATDEEHRRAVQRAREIHAWLKAQGYSGSHVVDSGNGLYVLLRVDLANDDASRELIRRCLAGLAFQFDDDQVHVDQTMFNAARIIRVPGTLNCKGDDTPDRPHRPVKPLYVPEQIEPVTLELLEQLAEVEPRGEEPNGQRGHRIYPPGDFDLEHFVRDHLDVLREGPWSNGGYRWVLRTCPFNSDHTDKAPWVARRSTGAIVAGCHHNSCTWGWAELREKFEPGYKRRREEWQQDKGRKVKTSAEPKRDHETAGVLLSDVEPERIDWLWYGRLARGKVTIIDGDPGQGKPVFSLDLAARITTGTAWPDDTPCPAGGVVLMSAEDGLADTIRPRFDVAGGDPTRVVALDLVPEWVELDKNRDGKWVDVPIVLPDHLHHVEAAIERVNATLVIVDPLMAFLSGDLDAHRDQDVRRALRPLKEMAERTNVAVLVIRHMNKSRGGPVVYRGADPSASSALHA